jgi:nitrite reductase/ring-hydroxylating ferredoxin subunit
MPPRYIEFPRPASYSLDEAQSLPVGSLRVAIFDVGDAVYAIEDSCVRCAGPLSQGAVNHRQVTCPSCGWTYELATGALTFLDAIRLQTFPVVVEPSRILVEWAS